uniref:E3 ubiquitin-protein ligase n=1 Tax=Anopheles epiroticus TaxID=199890 RepID=A0A182PKF4_9DIPT
MCPCRYAMNGCTWKFVQSEMDAHVAECRFRPYRCVANLLNVIKCDWQGLQHEIEEHMTKGHKELGPVFRFRERSSLVFKEQISLGGLKLVDAFSKRFLFYFFSDTAQKKLSFLMIYFGRREEASQYCYELEIRARPFDPAPTSTNSSKTPTGDTNRAVEDSASSEGFVFARSVKFVERCCSDSENLFELLGQDQCVTLTHRQVANYLHDGKLHIEYKVRKADGGREKKLSESVVPAGENPPVGIPVAPKPKPRPPPFVFSNKGTLPGAGKRSSSSSSSSSSASSSSKTVSSSESEKTVRSSSSSVASRSPSNASTVTVCSERNRNAGETAQQITGSLVCRDSLSSINRVTTPLTPFEKPEQCPLMTPSINKHDVPPSWTISQATMSSSFSYHTSTEYYRQVYGHEPYRAVRHYPPSECTTTAAVCQKYTQPYKVKDDRPYLLKHPTNCLYKPQPKWSTGHGDGGHGKAGGGWSA